MVWKGDEWFVNGGENEDLDEVGAGGWFLWFVVGCL